MTREDKCILAIKQGFTYNSKTGEVFGIKGKLITKRTKGYIELRLYDEDNNRKPLHLLAHQLAWYWVYKECVEILDHINRIRDDNRICNLRSVTSLENANNTVRSVNGIYSIRFKIGNEIHTYRFETKEEIDTYHNIYKNLLYADN